MTIMEALQWANDSLKQNADAFDSPMLDAQVLLAHVLGSPKSWLFTHLDQEMRAYEEEAFRKSVRRRAKHEPVAYITGIKEFYKRPFHVNRFVLIPRPATEILVDAALEILRVTSPNIQFPISNILFSDIGTGSGAIAITLAAESNLPVIAIDQSAQALAVAKKNAADLGVESLVDFRHGDLIEPLVAIFKKIHEQNQPIPFDHLIICANLPYLTERQWEGVQAEVRAYEPKEALVGGTDGLDVYWKLFRELLRHRDVLPKKITTLIEIDPSQSASILPLISHNFPGSSSRMIKDLEGFDRVVITEIP